MTRPALPTAGSDPSADALARVIAAALDTSQPPPATPFDDSDAGATLDDILADLRRAFPADAYDSAHLRALARVNADLVAPDPQRPPAGRWHRDPETGALTWRRA